MAKEKEVKTNAMRMLDKLKLPYKVHLYECDEFIDGVHIAELLGESCDSCFKTLVTANSEDTGSVENGGLYENIRITDNYVSEFLDWSFADGRKAGDSGIIETTYGYHIMYFVSDNTDDLDWKNTIRTDMGKAAFDEYNENLLADDGSYKVVENETWTSYVSKDFCKKFKKNLAYSSASKK